VKNIAFLIFNCLVLVFAVGFVGINPISLVNGRLLGLMVLPQVFFVLLSTDFKNPIPFIKRFLFMKTQEEDERVLAQLSTISLIQGFIGGLIGVIQIVGNLTDASKLGEAFALTLTALLYGVLGVSFYLPQTKGCNPNKVGIYIVMAVVVTTTAVLLVLYGVRKA